MSCISCTPWYVVSTPAGREKSLSAAFTRLSIPTFLPTFQAQKARNLLVYDNSANDYVERRQNYYSETVMFAGYLFVGLDDFGWARVKTRLGVGYRHKFLDFGAGPVVVERELLEDISQRVVAHNEIIMAKKKFKQGDAVSFLSGPFAGQAGLFSHDANERVFVLLRILGGERLVECTSAQIEVRV